MESLSKKNDRYRVKANGNVTTENNRNLKTHWMDSVVEWRQQINIPYEYTDQNSKQNTRK